MRDCVEIGEDPDREGLLKTPELSRALEFLTKGYHQDLDGIINNAILRQNPTT